MLAVTGVHARMGMEDRAIAIAEILEPNDMLWLGRLKLPNLPKSLIYKELCCITHLCMHLCMRCRDVASAAQRHLLTSKCLPKETSGVSGRVQASVLASINSNLRSTRGLREHESADLIEFEVPSQLTRFTLAAAVDGLCYRHDVDLVVRYFVLFPEMTLHNGTARMSQSSFSLSVRQGRMM